MKHSLLLLLLLLQSCLGFGQHIEGSWKGEVAIQGAKLPIIFHLKKQSEVVWSGDMVSPAQSATKLKFDKVLVSDDSLYVEAASIDFSFRGKLVLGRLQGIFTQREHNTALVMRPYEEKIPHRPQLPRPPYNYDTLDVTFENNFDAIRLAGTLTLPRATGLHPAVVLVTGSGPQDRDETIEGHKPFKVIADFLTKRGVIVLRYDERGVGKSTGNYTQSTIGDFSKDVIASVDFLRKQKNVDPKRVGIIGHSEGGLIAELIAGQRSAEVDFIALLAAPTIPIDSLLLLQAFELGRLQGMSDAELNQAKNINRRNFAIVKGTSKDDEAYKQILKNVAIVFANPSASQKAEFRMMLLPSYRYFMRINPVSFIKKINIPVFAAFGTKDVQVPFAPNLESLTDHLPQKNSHFLKAYEGINHLFQQAGTGSPQEYAEIEETFNENVLQDLADWISKR